MGLEEGTVVRWLKAVGERVIEGEALVEIETAKTTQEVGAPIAGVLVKICVNAGETTPVNTVLGEIEEAGGASE
jgi:pyruvate/2-oxoglutarate dehydrogenase complex dihydrolipoamide acyltransferase (E2) component